LINFNERTDRLPSGMILASIIVIVAALAFMVLAPPPTVNALAADHARQQQQIESQITTAKQQGEQTREEIMPRLWRQGADTVSATVLSQLTDSALKDKVAIGAFRPQRTQDLGGITELPFSVQVSGAYHGIHALMSSLDTPHTKIVLTSAQISASQANSNGITATLGLTAYLVTDPSILPIPAKETKRG
jgi:Tfp pilus assembly protein PilO